MMKRIFDICIACVAILIFSPIMLLSAFFIFVLDGRPILFRQTRVGKDMTPFTMVKFRTMAVDKNHDGVPDLGDSNRVSCVGKILRKTKCDELPQLWNVLAGDMSIVGPRPELELRMQAFTDMKVWQQAYSVRPGITGPASIIYRDEEEILSTKSDPQAYYNTVLLPEKLNVYVKYAHTYTLWYDICIIYKTIRAVLGKAYTKEEVL